MRPAVTTKDNVVDLFLTAAMRYRFIVSIVDLKPVGNLVEH
jgi:hypothetical protein